MPDVVRIAFIGAGSMANAVHYPSLRSFADVEIAAICDINSERLNTTADKYGVDRRYADYRRMIEDVAPDAVYAIGQPHELFDAWTWLLEHGQHLCIEKPMGLTIHQAGLLAHLADKHACITQVSFQRRAVPLLTALRAECLARGPITHAAVEFYKCAPDPYIGARDHMMDDGVHAIDTLRWLCGGEVARVESTMRRIGTPDLNFIAAMLHFDTGATGVLLNSWTSGRRIFRVQMHAPRICAEADPESRGVLYADGDTTGVVFDTRDVAGGAELFEFGGFRTKNREFIDALKARTQPQSCFADAVKTMDVAARILAQSLLRGD